MAKIHFLLRSGGLADIRVPVNKIGVGIGAEVWVALSPDESGIKIKPVRDSRPVRGRHSIEELVAGSSPDSFDGEVEWGDQQGKEIW